MINELRLGNYLQNSGNLVKVFRLDEKYREPTCVAIKKLPGQHVNVYRNDPIELTEQWLLRMGFEEDKIYKKCFRRGKFEVEFIDNDWRYELLNMVVILDWVHQLQNLHFATMREELEIRSDTML